MIKLKDIIETMNEPVPRYLFHATFKALVPSISSKGIIPGGIDYVNFEGATTGVYLSNDEGFAGSMVQNTENDKIPAEWIEEVVILVIETTELDLFELEKDPHYNPSDDGKGVIPLDHSVKSYIYKGTIPPSAIKEIIDFEG